MGFSFPTDAGDQKPAVAALYHCDRAAWTGDLVPPLQNLSIIQDKMERVRGMLDRGAMSWDQRTAISSEIDSAIRGIISSGSALLASCRQGLGQSPSLPSGLKSTAIPVPPPPQVGGETVRTGGNLDIVEIDAVELLAEHVHFCDICGKGFKRDANLRMHMRAHGNQYKTQEALAKPGRVAVTSAPVEAGKVRFSCPFAGCSRNQRHPRFRPLKSAICVKNHFKRSHCPKMYSCNKCNRKTFSVLADLKSHLKHCGQTRWACSCGTTFSRKDKLFGHMALFEGHMPAVEERKEDVKKEEQQQSEAEASVSGIIGGLTEEELGAIDQRYFESLGDDFFGSELEMGLEFSDMVPVDDAFRELL